MGVDAQVIGHHEDTDHESEDEPAAQFLTWREAIARTPTFNEKYENFGEFALNQPWKKSAAAVLAVFMSWSQIPPLKQGYWSRVHRRFAAQQCTFCCGSLLRDPARRGKASTQSTEDLLEGLQIPKWVKLRDVNMMQPVQSWSTMASLYKWKIGRPLNGMAVYDIKLFQHFVWGSWILGPYSKWWMVWDPYFLDLGPHDLEIILRLTSLFPAFNDKGHTLGTSFHRKFFNPPSTKVQKIPIGWWFYPSKSIWITLNI